MYVEMGIGVYWASDLNRWPYMNSCCLIARLKAIVLFVVILSICCDCIGGKFSCIPLCVLGQLQDGCNLGL